jgi:methyl-accepting chemotaxis protein
MILTLDRIRALMARSLVLLAFVHVPAMLLLALVFGVPALSPTVSVLVLAAFALATHAAFGGALVTRLAIALVLIGQVSVFVFSLSGHPWQPDGHMYYFAVLALLAGFCDWRPIIAGAALTALHHFVLQIVLPSAVFYQGGSYGRVLFHAVIVIVETVFLVASAAVMARLLEANRENLVKMQAIAEREREAAGREKQLAMETGRRSDAISTTVVRFRAQIEEAMAVLKASSVSMQTGAGELTEASEQARQQMAVVSQASGATTQSITHLTDVSMDLSATIAEIGRSAMQSAQGSKAAVDLAERASAEIGQLAQGSESIGGVVEIIRSIASQTNLLALNATIEAARAGEMGRGFSVVASEVKTLSAQTARATDDVSAQVASMQAASARSLQVIRDIAQAMRQIDEMTDAIAVAVHQQDRATAEIARQTRLSSEGARAGAGMVSSFATMTDRTHDAADRLKEASDVLAQQGEVIRRQITEFCETIAAA